MSKKYTREEIKAFHDNMYRLQDDGCYNVDVVTLHKMMTQDLYYWNDLNIARRKQIIAEKFPDVEIEVPVQKSRPELKMMLILWASFFSGCALGYLLWGDYV